jgi:two-component system KDP operon response regulator KdpE
LLIDLDKRHVEVHGRPIQLTPTEFRLLSTLLRNVGRVVSHEELIREVWGMEESASLASLKVYVHYLRRKIEDQPREPYYLLAEWGIGYRFREPNRALPSSF